ncbi:MAG: 3-phosphoshikimate 1-carboxyvinyltransferase [Ignavibacteriae bacterium]|nr:3-phosphoshikimate 1-carboxyvinyltransferase [Ignavibacteriota bacterium]
MTQTVIHSKGLRGTVSVPGDKSISHRALLFAALAEGDCEITGLSNAADPKSTMECLRAIGVDIVERDGSVTVRGKGLRGLSAPSSVLDAGNSGTTIRLLAGILSGQRFASEITGDASLRSRPMKRIIEPLSKMGANIRGTQTFHAPLTIQAVSKLRSISYEMPVASAQVKSAILLAGLYAEGKTIVVEKLPSRDHTERMLGLDVSNNSGERIVAVEGGMKIVPRAFVVPGDISAAAFFIAAGLLVPTTEVVIKNVGLNPTRTAVLDIFKQMGGKVEITNKRIVAGEPLGDVAVRSSDLHTGFELRGERVAALIDEIPILAVTAAFSKGVFAVREAKDLRAKESDRIKTIVTNLRAMELEVEEYEDGFAFVGRENLRGASVESYHDHRIAMAFAIAGLRATGETKIQNAECADISFPGFWDELKKL